VNYLSAISAVETEEIWPDLYLSAYLAVSLLFPTLISQYYKSAEGIRNERFSLAANLSFLLYHWPTLNSFSAQYCFQMWDCFSCCSSA